MTLELGANVAKRFGDANEVTVVNSIGAQTMDLYNNNIGRQLALDPANIGRKAGDVIMEALKKNRLQTAPFRIGVGPR